MFVEQPGVCLVVQSPADYPKGEENWQVCASQPVVSTKRRQWRSPREPSAPG